VRDELDDIEQTITGEVDVWCSSVQFMRVSNDYSRPIIITRPSLIITNRRIPTTRLIRPIPLQPLHLLPTQLKIKDLSILLDPPRRHAFRQRHKPLLQTPAQQHLSPRLPMPLRDLLQDWIFGPLTSNQGTVRFDDDATGTAPIDDGVTREPGVQFPLPDRDSAACAGAVLGVEGLDVGF
jgi:hypothetical protein